MSEQKNPDGQGEPQIMLAGGPVHKFTFGVFAWKLLVPALLLLAAFGVYMYASRATPTRVTTVQSTPEIPVPTDAQSRQAAMASLIARGSAAEAISTYDELIAGAGVDADKAAYYTERANVLHVYGGDAYAAKVLTDATQADKLAPTAVSARLVYDLMTEQKDAGAAAYWQTYLNRSGADNARPE